MMLGFEFQLNAPYFTTFRKPTSTSLILSYTVPPYTTLRGLLSNALGQRRDDYSIQDWVRIGITPSTNLDRFREMAKILKLKGTGKTHNRFFPSSPIFKELLVAPTYRIFLAGDEEKIKQIHNALQNPKRPLYLGASDDLVDIELSDLIEVKETKTKQVTGVVEGIHEKCAIENLPYKFIRTKVFSVDYKTVSIPYTPTIILKEEINCYRFGNDNVLLL